MASFAARAHSGSCTACCLPGAFPQRCSPHSQATGNCCQQHNCCVVGRAEHRFFLEEENPSRRKVFPGHRTLLCPLCIHNTISWSARSLSFCSSGPVLEYINCSSWFSVICTLDSAACCPFHVTDQTGQVLAGIITTLHLLPTSR